MTDKDHEKYLMDYTVPPTMSEETREKYINQLKDAARDIFIHANEYIGSSPGLYDLIITIKLHPVQHKLGIDEDCPIISTERLNIIPSQIGAPKDTSDPYKKPYMINEGGVN